MRGAKGVLAAKALNEGYARTCARGLAMHLTNPKSIVVWLSVVSLARRAYRAGERWVNAVLAGVFAYAGVRMLLAGQGR